MSHREFTSRFHWSGYLLGFGVGGFFDGILLHQILQWHHLLSGLQSGAFRDIRNQILADGLFHALMYVIAAVGLWMLWQARREISAAGADRKLFGDLLIGFGVWHIVDSIFSHWVTGIHRIRMDSANPLVWDLIWFAVFGIVPLALQLVRRNGTGSGGATRGPVAAALVVGAVLVGGAVSSLPPPNVSQVMVYFRPGTTPQQVIAAADAVGARIIWSDASGELWAFDLPERGRSVALYRHGALFVGNSFFPVGCLSWSRAV